MASGLVFVWIAPFVVTAKIVPFARFAVLAVISQEWVHSKDFLSPWAGIKALYGKPHDLARKDAP